MLGVCHFIFATFSNEKVFTVTVTATLVRSIFPKTRKLRKKLIKNGKIKISKEQKLNSISYRSHNDRNNLFPWHLNFLHFFFIFSTTKNHGQPIFSSKVLGLTQQNFAKECDFWHFPTPSRHVRRCRIILTPCVFAICGSPRNQKVFWDFMFYLDMYL